MDKKNKVKSIVKFDDEKQPEEVIEEVKEKKKKKKEQLKKKLQVQQRHVTIAIPDSIISNAQSSELRIYFMSQLARMFAIFQVDEVIILRDYSYIPKSKQFDVASYVVRNLQYLETPQYLRKYLFPIHSDLKMLNRYVLIEKELLLKDLVKVTHLELKLDSKDKFQLIIHCKQELELHQKQMILLLLIQLVLLFQVRMPKKKAIIGVTQLQQSLNFIDYSYHHNYLLYQIEMILIETEKSDESVQTTTFNPRELSQQPLKLLLLFSGLQKIIDFTENDEKSKLSKEDIYGKF